MNAPEVAPRDPLLVTMSGPGVVRVVVYPGGGAPGVFVEGTPEGGEANAWCLLDSVRLAYEKADRDVPLRIRAALAALRTPRDVVTFGGAVLRKPGERG